MRFGFIGAGKVGCSLGKYLVEKGVAIEGYYSRSLQSAKEAANFTKTRYYSDMKDLVEQCDGIFITVSDSEIVSVYDMLKQYISRPVCMIHCSGLKSSEVFYDISRYHSYGYSIHPLLAIHSKFESYQELSKAIFTIEGSDQCLEELCSIFRGAGNEVVTIKAQDKVKYHTAAVFSSNLMIALMQQSFSLFRECGFNTKQAMQALKPLATSNLEHIFDVGIEAALTGPIERNDMETVKKHRECLSAGKKQIYDLLSKELVKIAINKHEDKDYRSLKEMFEML